MPPKKPVRAALYLRVSTGEQTTANQERELRDAAARHGWEVVEVFRDKGVSGAKGREQRKGLDALMKAVARREVDLVAVWSVDRLGRSLQDLLSILQELHAKGVGLYLHQQGIDTTTPGGKALFQMMGVFAEFERAMIVERTKAGMARARAEGATIGRPRVGGKRRAAIVKALKAGRGVRAIAKELETGVSVVLRVRDEEGIEARPQHTG